MLIFGHKYIDSPNFIKIDSKEELHLTTPKDIVLIELKEPYTLPKYLKDNNISYAVFIDSIKDAIFANIFDANYVICEFDLAKIIQKIATEYLWDMKILALIDSDDMLEKIALNYIDGVVYKNFLKGGKNES